jgi:hypothetical protein
MKFLETFHVGTDFLQGGECTGTYTGIMLLEGFYSVILST